MGGDISVSSTQGEGSEFIATINVEVNTQALIEDSPQLSFAEPFDVLLIDDNEDDLSLIKSQLSAMGLRCTPCKQASDAIEIIKENINTYKIIIVDCEMPTMSSETFFTRIYKVNPQLCNNIIVLTASKNDAIYDIAKKINIKTILHKPVLTSVLFEAMKSKVVSPSTSNTHKPATEKPLQGVKILVVEDNAINRLIVSDILAASGAQVHVVENGLECIQTVKLKSYDIILMDIHMPIMDGVEATKVIRSDSNTALASMPIIALTANVMKDDITHYLSIGMNAHVAKPIKAKTLRDTILNCLNK